MRKNLLTVGEEQLLMYSLQYYKLVVGNSFDVNHPVLFTEKIQWYTFFYKNPIIPYIVDKVTFKQYVEDRLGPGHTIPMFGYWDSIESFEREWGTLPDEFCLKANLQSDGRNIKVIHNKNEIDFPVLKQEVAEWLKPENTLMNSLARNFYMSTPRILAEQYMSNIRNQLFDYKIYCFDGSPFCICASMNHFEDEFYPITYYDLNWDIINVRSGLHKNSPIPMPAHFNEMKSMASKLSSGFPFVRVDFFDTDEKLYLAEMTFNPGGGFFKYEPDDLNRIMGDLFILPQSS